MPLAPRRRPTRSQLTFHPSAPPRHQQDHPGRSRHLSEVGVPLSTLLRTLCATDVVVVALAIGVGVPLSTFLRTLCATDVDTWRLTADLRRGAGSRRGAGA